RWPTTPRSPPRSTWTSTSPTPTRHGNAAATRTPTACSVSTSRKAPTCQSTAKGSSTPSPPNSTTDPANDTPSRHPPRCSTSYSRTHPTHPVLQRPHESAAATPTTTHRTFSYVDSAAAGGGATALAYEAATRRAHLRAAGEAQRSVDRRAGDRLQQLGRCMCRTRCGLGRLRDGVGTHVGSRADVR